MKLKIFIASLFIKKNSKGALQGTPAPYKMSYTITLLPRCLKNFIPFCCSSTVIILVKVCYRQTELRNLGNLFLCRGCFLSVKFATSLLTLLAGGYMNGPVKMEAIIDALCLTEKNTMIKFN